jgi:biopolymer transport protein TolQ
MDFPLLVMIQRSDWLTRGILVLLGVFSVAAWAIIFNRMVVFSSVRRAHQRFRKLLGSGEGLAAVEGADAAVQESPMGELGKVSQSEYRRILADATNHTSVSDWSFFLTSQFAMADERLEAAITSGVTRLDRGLILLAIMSSASPFLGLFGTVWGIMDAFYNIGQQGSASLPVVAPGIAAALVATIAGLAVAIPAVLFYNYFLHRAQRGEDELSEVKQVLLVRLKRDVFSQFYGKRAEAAGGNTP